MEPFAPPSSRPTPPAAPLRLLKGVSRSFYLSIRLLPAQLREPIGVAYLLARATDTIADTARLAPAARLDKLQTLAQAIDGDGRARDALASVTASFAVLQSDPAERTLIESLPQALAWLDALAAPDRQDVRAVLRTIVQGQSLDVQRFGDGAGPVRALATAGELRDYTFLVAGCVGEFWTLLCFRHLPRFATLPRDTMMALGRRYGMGLQLINILRDAPDDLIAGRCYFPADELMAAGLSLSDVAADPTRLAPIARPWHEEATRLLDDGMRYAAAVNSRRVRAASALPALIGARTLALLRPTGAATLGRIKVQRGEVRAILARLALTLAGRGPLQALYLRLGAPVLSSGDGTITP